MCSNVFSVDLWNVLYKAVWLYCWARYFCFLKSGRSQVYLTMLKIVSLLLNFWLHKKKINYAFSFCGFMSFPNLGVSPTLSLQILLVFYDLCSLSGILIRWRLDLILSSKFLNFSFTSSSILFLCAAFWVTPHMYIYVNSFSLELCLIKSVAHLYLFLFIIFI